MAFLPVFKPITVVALSRYPNLRLQAENIARNWMAVVLLAIPIPIQVYFNSCLT
jgi:arsenite transporter